MAKNFNFLHDIEIKRNSPAYTTILIAPRLGAELADHANRLKALYQMRVGVKTGKLKASAQAYTTVGGRLNDRLVGKVTIADQSVVAPEPYKGAPFYYGVFHEEGNKGKGRSRKRKYGTEGYHELRQVAHQMRGTP